jgi:hypothetical protein
MIGAVKIHLLREYQNKKGVGECGKSGLRDDEITLKACEVTCPRCKTTRAFLIAARDPFWGIKKLEPWEENMFK